MFKLNVIWMVFFACLVSAGCAKKGNEDSSTQVAAKVDNAEISLHQINQVMKTAKNVTAENAVEMRKQILDKLIDQQIIVDKALKEDLDRTPDVMMAIESAKKDILARAYLQKLVTDEVKISDQDVRKYYDAHPELFSKRRIYNLQDIGAEKNDQVLAIITTQLDQHKSLQEIADLLKLKGIQYSAGAYTRPAEQIPLEILPEIQKLSDGESTVLIVANTMHAIKVVKSQDAPIDYKAAIPFIRNYFINTKGKELVDQKMKSFRSEAKVEYMGDFSNLKTELTPNLPVLSNPTQEANEKNAKETNSSLDEGISGLK